MEYTYVWSPGYILLYWNVTPSSTFTTQLWNSFDSTTFEPSFFATEISLSVKTLFLTIALSRPAEINKFLSYTLKVLLWTNKVASLRVLPGSEYKPVWSSLSSKIQLSISTVPPPTNNAVGRFEPSVELLKERFIKVTLSAEIQAMEEPVYFFVPLIIVFP